MLNKIKSSVNKIAWALVNGVPPTATQYDKRQKGREGVTSTLVIVIDYDKFSKRKVKRVGNTDYPCGREGLEHVVEYCKSSNLDYVDVMTTDNEDAPRAYDGPVNKSISLRNGGSDIAALEALSGLVKQYAFVIVVNSSANVRDAKKIASLHHELNNCSARHFVIGRNGNSRISPRLPLTPPLTPHVITNMFACPSQDVLDTLANARKLVLYSLAGGFANKYFAIRYFEIMLSRNALSNGGELILMSDDHVQYCRGPIDAWPRMDSRLSRR